MNFSEFIKKYATHPNYKAPTGNLLHAKSWQTEAPLRMLLNNLDRQVAENPEELVVYGGTGQAARNPEAFLQGTYETFVTCGEKYFKGDLKHKLLVSGGLGGMGGAQPLAATMAGATFLGVDVDPDRIKKRLNSGYIDHISWSYDEAVSMILMAKETGEAISVGL